MIIKTFTGESSAAALKRVRKEMGGDAVVLKTRRISGPADKPIFEVTACLERASVGQAATLLPDKNAVEAKPVGQNPRPEPEPATSDNTTDTTPDTRSPNLDERINAIDRKLSQLISLGIQPDGITRLEVFQTVHRCLKEADLPDDYLESFISTLVEAYDGSEEIITYAHRQLTQQLEPTIDAPIEYLPGDRITFVGPAGSGKSSVMGKLAATLAARQKRKVKLLSLDDNKLAAFDEICSYADILGLEVVPPPSVLEQSEKDKDAITLIDCPALPTKHDKRLTLKARIEEVAPRYRFAVFSCLTRSRDVFEISKMLKELNPTHLILTMEDIASCHGTFVTAARATGLKIAYLSDAPGGIGELKTPDPDALARKLLNLEVSRD
ncbi:MAG: hypothetical protein JSV52_11920 [Candidatus Zixiibacteriota bacterium]|nr:MAG: hypothetical protein JSV52_11920 [candidate division Zixibacteria bacterium]